MKFKSVRAFLVQLNKYERNYGLSLSLMEVPEFDGIHSQAFANLTQFAQENHEVFHMSDESFPKSRLRQIYRYRCLFGTAYIPGCDICNKLWSETVSVFRRSKATIALFRRYE
jgi:hypothetical protein